MILNATDTKLLKSAIQSDSTLVWLHDDTARISGTVYSGIVSDFASWKSAYDQNDLYITTGGGTQQLTGIDQFPVPPSR